MKIRTMRACLFGGALLTAGLCGPDANAQELVVTPESELYVWGYDFVTCAYCYSRGILVGDPFDSGTFVTDATFELDGITWTSTLTDSSFRYTAEPNGSGNQPGFTVEYAYAYLDFTVTEAATLDVAFEYGSLSPVAFSIAGVAYPPPFNGRIELEAGELVSIDYRAVGGDAFVFGATTSISISIVTAEPCNPADLAEPLGSLTFADINAFLMAFVNQDPAADLAAPSGQYTFADITAFLDAFAAGCP
jgi:hypothetical protein